MRAQVFGTLALTALLFVSTPLSTRIRAGDASVDAKYGEIVVRVIDEARMPLRNARLSLFAFDANQRLWNDTHRDARADSSGSARYDGLLTERAQYLVRAKTDDGRIGVRSCLFRDGVARLEIDLTVQRPVSTTIHLHDQAGRPIAGASLWVITHIGVNGLLRLIEPRSLANFGRAPERSDAAGNLVIPELPPGKIFPRFVHADYAPAGVDELTIPSSSTVDVAMLDGVKVILDFTVPEGARPIKGLRIRLPHDPTLHPSSLDGELPELRADGKAQLTLAAGKYYSLGISHPDYIVTPEYNLPNERIELRTDFDNRFTFQLRPKVRVRGRVVNESSGNPVARCWVSGETDGGVQDGPFARFASKWTGDVGSSSQTDDHGGYELKLPPGPARINASFERMFARPEYQAISVAPDGSTTVPDIVLWPIPKVRGVVRDQDGQPAARAIVRFRDSDLFADVPVVTDAHGRFELSPDRLPADLLTGKPKPLQTVLAFHPWAPLGAEATVDFAADKALGDITLRLEQQSYDGPVARFPDEGAALRQGLTADTKTSAALLSGGAPELDGAAWLNTDKPRMSLADFRGKFVLLQFWTTWCGPCHGDMPTLKLANELYKDKGLVIIGIHDNSTPIDGIKQDVAAQKLPYPIVVDHQDGRILSAYKPLGVKSYPTYFLISPEGSIVPDPTGSGKGLRFYILEMIRQQLMTRETVGH